MPLEQEVSVRCLDCGENAPFVIRTSVDTQTDPQAADRLVDGSLFTFQCPKCGSKTILNFPILYHDVQRRTIVQYVPDPKDLDHAAGSLKKLGQTVSGAGQQAAPVRLRLVTDLNSLREKAIIAREGLDDRAIELFKALIVEHMGKDVPEPIEYVFFYAEGKDRHFEVLSKKSHLGNFAFVQEIYDSMAALLADSPEFDADDTLVIDPKWAVDTILTEHLQRG